MAADFAAAAPPDSDFGRFSKVGVAAVGVPPLDSPRPRFVPVGKEAEEDEDADDADDADGVDDNPPP
jgi:hypothetical protein